MIFMTKLCLIILGVILVIYIINAVCVLFFKNKKNKFYNHYNTSVKIPFIKFNLSLVKLLENECGAPNKPLRGDDISYNDNIKKYKEITVEGTCPEKKIIKACK